jgi:hypothetical protein
VTTEYAIRITAKDTDKDLGFYSSPHSGVMIFVVKAKAFKWASDLNKEFSDNKYEVYKLTKLNNPNED